GEADGPPLQRPQCKAGSCAGMGSGHENDRGDEEKDSSHFLTQSLPSASMNSFVPFRPVRLSVSGPPSGWTRMSMSKNGQQRRSCSTHSATSANVFASDGKSSSYPFASSCTSV